MTTKSDPVAAAKRKLAHAEMVERRKTVVAAAQASVTKLTADLKAARERLKKARAVGRPKPKA